MQENNKIIIFLPARDEAATVASVIMDSKNELSKYSLQADFLVIDDGSTDDTQAEAKKAGAHVIRHRERKGLGFIFREAVNYARSNDYDILVTIDSDKQFKEAEIIQLINTITREGADFVTGSRFIKKQQIKELSCAKKIGNYIVAIIISNILDNKYYDVTCGFRAYNRKALDYLYITENFTYTQEVFLNLGVKGICIKEIPISVTYYADRKSRIAKNLFLYGRRILSVIIKCVIIYRPMKLFGPLSVVCFTVGVPILVVDSVGYLITNVVPYKSIGIASLILVIMGTIFLTTGLLLKIISRMQLTIEETLYNARKR
jgi:glycosyltransferase involved in cell wall biosynthesis